MIATMTTPRMLRLPASVLVVVFAFSLAGRAICQEASKLNALYDDYQFVHCLREKFKTIERDPGDPTRAFDPQSGRNFFWDRDKEEWIDSKTGEVVCGPPTASQKNAIKDDYQFVNCLREKFKTIQRDPSDPTRAFDPQSGRNFFWDRDKEAWIDSKTGEQICPPPTATTPPPPTTPKTNDVVKTASVPARFELGLGYSYMHPDAEVVKSLNGFAVSGYYNVNSWLAFGGEFSGLYGTETETRQFMVGDMKKDIDVKTSLDRYLYLFGPQVTWHPCEHAKLFGHVLVGGVHDRNEVAFPDGSMRSSADAFALAVGVGVDFQITRHFSVGPSFDYVPTHFTSPTGDNWQNNWRVGVVGKISF
jgi:opacity protein-like surface antigen